MSTPKLHYLEDRWNDALASKLDQPELLRYRSNLLGSDLRITNFGGGNTSSKIEEVDPLDGEKKTVLWVKGSGGDLGSIQRAGFATLYMDKLLLLQKSYKGVEREDEIAAMYPLCTFNSNPVAASIDTTLHGYLPFPHIDHLHPDWCIALAASANGHEKMAEFNGRFRHTLVWLPWQRPGFELALMMQKAVAEAGGCDGIVLGGHGLFTWGETQRESYLNTITIIDQLGQFVLEHGRKRGVSFGGTKYVAHEDRARIAAAVMPYLRGKVSNKQRVIGSFFDSPEVLAFVNSTSAGELAHLGTSCPDHFIRTKIRPLFVAWDPASEPKKVESAIDEALTTYRAEYADYYKTHALPDSPAMRDSNPSVVLIPGLGMFSFGKNKTESRLVSEFYTNAIHVMDGAGGMDEGRCPPVLPQAGSAAPTSAFGVHSNYVALPPSEAFRIEYWALEEAKLRRQPPEKELSRRIVLIVGGASGIGREVVLLAAERGAHIVVADLSLEAAQKVADEAKAIAGKESVVATKIDIASRDAIKLALEATTAAFGGIDILINIGAVAQTSSLEANYEPGGVRSLHEMLGANKALTDEAAKIFKAQSLPASILHAVSTESVRGTAFNEASQTGFRDHIRELADTHSPLLRINGVALATHVTGPANDPKLFAEAILFLSGPKSEAIEGQFIPIGSGLVEPPLTFE